MTTTDKQIAELRRLDTFITIKIVNAKDGDAMIHNTAPRAMLQAVATAPNGQVIVQGEIRQGHDAATQAAAVAELEQWIAKHRPDWTITADSPIVNLPESTP